MNLVMELESEQESESDDWKLVESEVSWPDSAALPLLTHVPYSQQDSFTS
jgi:hypothetical protein